MHRVKTAALAIVLGVTVATVGMSAPVSAHSTGIHDNCTNLNKKYPHGLGTRKAVDKTTGAQVTTFTRNTDAYSRADRHNGTLDRDNDRIACEKR